MMQIKPKKKLSVKINKGSTKKEKKPKTVGKFSGIPLPLPEFPKGYEELQKFVLHIATLINQENIDIDFHKRESYFDVQDVWGHIFNSNLSVDRVLYLVVTLLHMNAHLLAKFEDIDTIKQTITKVNEDMDKHRPKLEYIDQKVQEHQQSEEKAKQIYG